MPLTEERKTATAKAFEEALEMDREHLAGEFRKRLADHVQERVRTIASLRREVDVLHGQLDILAKMGVIPAAGAAA